MISYCSLEGDLLLASIWGHSLLAVPQAALQQDSSVVSPLIAVVFMRCLSASPARFCASLPARCARTIVDASLDDLTGHLSRLPCM